MKRKTDPFVALITSISESGASGPTAKTLRTMAAKTRSATNLTSCSIALYDSATRSFHLTVTSPATQDVFSRFPRDQVNNLLLSAVARLQPATAVVESEDGQLVIGKRLSAKVRKSPWPHQILHCTPIPLSKKPLGALLVQPRSSEAFFRSDADTRLAVLGQVISLVFGTSTLVEENRQAGLLAKRRLRFLAEFGNHLLRCRNLRSVYGLATHTTMRTLPSRTASIFMFSKLGLLERTKITGLSENTLPRETFSRGQGFTGRTVGTPTGRGSPQVCNNVRKSEIINSDHKVRTYVAAYEDAIRKEHKTTEEASHLLTVPLDGAVRTFGVLRVVNKIDPTTGKLSRVGFTDKDRDELFLIANLAASAIANIRRRSKDHLLNSVSGLLSSKKRSEALNRTARLITDENTCYSHCVIRVFNKESGILTIEGTSETIERRNLIESPDPFADRCFARNRVVKVNIADVGSDSEILNWLRRECVQTGICLPLRSLDRTGTLGVLCAYVGFRYVFDRSDTEFLEAFAKQISGLIHSFQERDIPKRLNALSRKINQSATPRDVSQRLVEGLPDVVALDKCYFVAESPTGHSVTAANDRTVLGRPISLTKDLWRRGSGRRMSMRCFGSEYQEIHWKLGVSSEGGLVLGVPVFLKGELYGAIFLTRRTGSGSPRGLLSVSGVERTALTALANQCGMSVERQRLLASQKHEEMQRAVSNGIIERISIAENLDPNLQLILDETVRVLDGDMGYIALLGKTSREVIPEYVYGLRKDNFPKMEIGKHGIAGWAYRQGKACRWPGGPADAQYLPYSGLGKKVRSEVVAPMLYANDVIGLLSISSSKDSVFSTSDRNFVQAVASQTAVIVQNRQFQEAAFTLGAVSFPRLESKYICKQLADATAEILGTPVVCVWLLREIGAQRFLEMEAWHGVEIEDPAEYSMPEADDGLSWQTIAGDKDLQITDDIQSPSVRFMHPEFAKTHNLHSMISVPLRVGKFSLGVINGYARRVYNFFDRERILIQNLAKSGAAMLRNADLTNELNEIHERILDTAQLANPGHLAMAFTHEARHAMNRINALLSSLVSLLPESVRTSAPGNSVIDGLTEQSDYLRKLFRSLVQYAKGEEVQYEWTKIRDILDYVVYIFRSPLERKHIKPSIRYEGVNRETLQIQCDKHQLEQVFVNLFNNAIFAIEQRRPSGGEITVVVSRPESGWVEIDVTDNGVGVPEEDYQRIFEPFYTTKGRLGSGFGLTICRRVIKDNHSGRISVVSTVNKDTTFIVRLPVK